MNTALEPVARRAEIGDTVKAKGCLSTSGTVVDISGELIRVKHNERQVAGSPFTGWGPRDEWYVVEGRKGSDEEDR